MKSTAIHKEHNSFRYISDLFEDPKDKMKLFMDNKKVYLFYKYAASYIFIKISKCQVRNYSGGSSTDRPGITGKSLFLCYPEGACSIATAPLYRKQ